MINKNLLIGLTLVVALLSFVGITGVQAGSAGRITGGFYSLDFFGIAQGWFNFNVREIDPATGDAAGNVHWKEYSETDGLRFIKAHPICIAFDKYDGQPAATFVVKVDSIRGWQDPAEFEGELMKIWVVDTGAPGREGDLWSTLGPWPPTDNLDDYGCHYEDPFFPPFPVDGGNLTIHE